MRLKFTSVVASLALAGAVALFTTGCGSSSSSGTSGGAISSSSSSSAASSVPSNVPVLPGDNQESTDGSTNPVPGTGTGGDNGGDNVEEELTEKEKCEAAGGKWNTSLPGSDIVEGCEMPNNNGGDDNNETPDETTKEGCEAAGKLWAPIPGGIEGFMCLEKDGQ